MKIQIGADVEIESNVEEESNVQKIDLKKKKTSKKTSKKKKQKKKRSNEYGMKIQIGADVEIESNVEEESNVQKTDLKKKKQKKKTSKKKLKEEEIPVQLLYDLHVKDLSTEAKNKIVYDSLANVNVANLASIFFRLAQAIQKVLQPAVMDRLEEEAKMRGWKLVLVTKDDHASLQSKWIDSVKSEWVEVDENGQVTFYISTAFYNTLEMIINAIEKSKILGLEKTEIMDKLIDELMLQIFLHEQNEKNKLDELLKKGKAQNIAGKLAHDYALQESGSYQKLLVEYLGDLHTVQSAKYYADMTQADIGKIQQSLDRSLEFFETLINTNIPKEKFNKVFRTARQVIAEFSANQYYKDGLYILNVSDFNAAELKQFLSAHDLLNKKGLRVILASDIANPGDSQAVAQVKRLVNNSKNVEWVYGEAVEEHIEATNKRIKRVAVLPTGDILTPAGVLSEENYQSIRIRLEKASLNAHDIAFYLNNLIKNDEGYEQFITGEDGIFNNIKIAESFRKQLTFNKKVVLPTGVLDLEKSVAQKSDDDLKITKYTPEGIGVTLKINSKALPTDIVDLDIAPYQGDKTLAGNARIEIESMSEATMTFMRAKAYAAYAFNRGIEAVSNLSRLLGMGDKQVSDAEKIARVKEIAAAA
ncbi:MAG: hypothetical protein GY817_06920 [bacterium]|nr:hypothetical protein [bacterium]